MCVSGYGAGKKNKKELKLNHYKRKYREGQGERERVKKEDI